MRPRHLLAATLLTLVTLTSLAASGAAQSVDTTAAAAVATPPAAAPDRVDGRVDIHGDPLPPGAVVRLGSNRLRHTEAIRGLSFLDGTDLISSAGFDGQLRVWATDTGHLVRDLRPVRSGLSGFAASVDGRRVVLGAREDASRLVTLPSGLTQPLPVPGDRFALSGDGAWVAGWTDRGDAWTVGRADGTGEPRVFSDDADRLDGAALSADGSLLVGVGRRILSRTDVHALVRVWSTADARLLADWELPGALGTSLALSPSAETTRVLVGLADGRLILLQVGLEAPVADVRAHPTTVTALTIAPDGSLLTGSYAGDLALWAPARWSPGETPEPLWRLGAHRGPVRALAASADGALLVSGGDDRTVRLWHADGTPALAFDRHESGLRAVARSPGGTLLATGDWAGRIAVWPSSGAAPRWLVGHLDAVSTLTFLDETLLVSTSRDGQLRLWDTTSGEAPVVLPLESAVLDAAASPDGRHLVTARGDGLVQLWTVTPGDADPLSSRQVPPTLTPGATLESGGSTAFAVSFTPDGRSIAIASSVVRLYAIEDGELLWEYVVRSPVADLDFSPDGTRLAVAAADRSVHLIDARNGSLQARLPGHDGRVEAVAFSPDGTMVASAGTHGSAILLWDAATGERRPELAGHEAPVSALDWSRVGDILTLISASADGTALVWSVAP